MKHSYIQVLTGILCMLSCFSYPMTGAAADSQPNAIPLRGIVEGFYGTPWTQEDRISTLQFMGSHNMNLYIYAPKNDPYHREKWREPYPPEEMAHLQQLIHTAQQNNVEFVFAISPGLDMQFDGIQGQQDFTALLKKFNLLYNAGVRQFAIFFDDIKNKDALRQAQVLNEINRQFVHKRPDVQPLLTVPTEYFSADMINTQGTKPYTAVFASKLDKDIIVMYSGPGVVCEGISLSDISKVEQIYGRKMAIWWNYPVSDYRTGKLALGPITGMEPGVSEHMAAFLMNPMEHAVLSRIALETGADYTTNPQTYDAETAWNHALHEQYGALADDMKIFADHSQRMNNNWAHTGRPDAPLLRQHIDAMWQTINNNSNAMTEQKILKDDFETMEQASIRLQQALPSEALQEGKHQLYLLQQLAAADQTALFIVQSEQEGHTHIAKTLDRLLTRQQKDLLPAEQAILSEKTAASFLQETQTWYEKKTHK